MSIYELRRYEVAPGRMGDLHVRMRDIVPPLFARNGLPKPTAIWETFAGPGSPGYIYLLHWPDMRAREVAFDRQYADTDRPTTRNVDGQEITPRIHLAFLRPAECWADVREPASAQPVGGVHEMVIHRLANQRLGEAQAALATVDLPFLKSRGARVLGVMETWVGLQRPGLVSILAWPDLATRDAALAAHLVHPAAIAARAAEVAKGGRPLFAAADTFLMQPAEYNAPTANLGHFSG